MKKLVSCLLVLCMVLSFGGAVTAAEADTSISVTATREKAEVGEEVTFTFVLNNPGKKAVDGVKFSVSASAGLRFCSAEISPEATDGFYLSDFSNNTFNAVIGDDVTDTCIEMISITYSVAEGTPAGAILPVGVDGMKETLVFMTVQNGSDWETVDLTCDLSRASASVIVTQCSNGHAMDSGTVTVPPSCTEPGIKTYTCTICGYAQTEDIPATGHTPKEAERENETSATCTEPGSYDEVRYCGVCGEELSRTTKSKAALGHDWGEWVTEQEATEEQEGRKTRSCQRDPSHVEEETIPRLEHQHTLTYVPETPATCTEPGTGEHWVCSSCGMRFADEGGETETTSEALSLPAKGHKSGTPEETVTKEPTCTETGVRTIITKCTVCGAVCETTTETIPAKGHTPGVPVVENVVPATEEEAGHHEEAVYCTVCEVELSRETVWESAAAPVITGFPADVTVLVGEDAVFTVNATGIGLTYRWQESHDGGNTWTDCSEAGSQMNSLRFTVTAVHHGRTYRCLVSNPGGTVISGAATLTVTGALITQQPKSAAIEEGDRATFTVKAVGNGLTYRWQESRDGGATWGDCTETGSDTDTLSLLPRASWSGWKYRCRIIGSGLTTISEPATLTVTIPKNKPTFQTQNLVLSGQIGVNFFLDLSSLTEAERKAGYMEFTLSGKGGSTSIDTFDPNHMNASKKYYGFTCYVKSIQMAETITATYHYGDGKTISKTYSVEEYFQVFEEHASAFDQKTTDLIHAIADYGHYMQIYLASVNGFDIGTDYAESARYYATGYDYADIRSKVTANAIVKAITGSKVEKANYRLQLGSETTLDVFLTTTDGSAPTGVTLTIYEQVSGKTTTKTYTPVKQTDGRYLITIPNISAHKLGDMIEITGKDSNGKYFTVNVSALSFVYDVLDKLTDAASRDGVSALYAYFEATVAYKTTQ